MNIYWNNNLTGGTNQNTNPDLMKSSEFLLLSNVSQSYLGTLTHRLGTDRFLNTISGSNPVRGLHMYQKSDGNNYLHMVQGGNLYYNGASTWTLQASAEFNTNSEIDMVNFLDRHYMASSTAGENLRYATNTGATTTVVAQTSTVSTSSTGSKLIVVDKIFTSNSVGLTVTNVTDSQTRTITGFTDSNEVTVDTAINDTWDGDTIEIYIDGKYLATNGAYMMIAGNSAFPRRAFYSLPESDTFQMGSDYFVDDLPITGIAAFGNGSSFIIFSKESYMIADPVSIYTTRTKGYGCLSHRSIQNIRGRVIWFGKDGFYMLGSNQSYPEEISKPISNTHTKDAIIEQINSTNYEVTASWTVDSRYFCALRNLSSAVKGVTLNDCVVEIDVANANWKVHTYVASGIATVACDFIDSNGNYKIYAGSYDNSTVYQLEVPGVFTDDNGGGGASDVTATVITKPEEFAGGNTVLKLDKINKLHFKYKSENAITVNYALDGSSTYTGNFTLPAYTATDWTWDYVHLGVECKSISVKLEWVGDATIYGIGYEVDSKKNYGLKGV